LTVYRHPIRPPRRSPRLVASLLVFSACLLAGNAGLTLLYLDASSSGGRVVASDAAGVIASRFYDTVNEAIVTGDTGPVAQLLAPEFVGYSGHHGPPTGRGELLASVEQIRALAPGLRLRAVAVSAALDDVTLQVDVTGTETGAFLGLVPPSELATWGWGPIETVRIVGGLIAARTSGADAGLKLIAQTALPRVDPATRWVVALLRLTLEPDTAITVDNADATRFWSVESGALSMSMDHRQTEHHEGLLAGGKPVLEPSPVLADPPDHLAVGDGLLTLPWQRFRAANAGSSPLSVLVAVLVPTSMTSYAPETFVWQVRLNAKGPAGLPEGVGEDMLSITLAPNAADELALGQMTLSPEAILTWPSIDRPTVLAVDRGQLKLAVPPVGASSVRADGTNRDASELLLQDGDNALVSAGTAMTWTATTMDPTVVFVLTLGPSSGRIPATPVS
jgi:hypothetical protein